MSHRLLPALAFLTACGNPLSNALFLEDAEFLAAIPSAENHSLIFPDSPDGDPASLLALLPLPGHAADLRAQSAGVAANLNASLTQLMVLGDYVRVDEPSVREDDLRSWGPSSLENGTRALLLVDIVRSGVGQYDWAFMASESSAGPWEPFYQGTHYSGATVAQGDGEFEADIGALAQALGEEREGWVSAQYDLREGTRLQLDLREFRESAEDQPLNAHYLYQETSTGGADFQYGIEADVSGEDLQERVAVRTRWKASTAMRADSRMFGGDMGSQELTISQCWDDQGALVFQEDSWGLLEPVGSESDCAYAKPLFAEDW